MPDIVLICSKKGGLMDKLRKMKPNTTNGV
jgi:hypothetical protein